MTRQTKIIAALAVVFLLTLGAVMFTQSQNTDSGVQGVQTTQTILESRPASQIQEIINSNKNSEELVVLDLRTPQEHELGHIADSRLINFYDPSFSQSLDELDKDKTYVIYCNSGNRSKSALGLMESKSFQEVYELEGGIQEWISAGYNIAI